MYGKRLAAAAAAFAILAGMTACRDNYTREGGEITSAPFSVPETVTEAASAEEFPLSSKVVADRMGGVAQVPKNVNRIVSVGDHITEMLAGLGAGGRVIAADDGSKGIDGIDSARCIIEDDASVIDKLSPDVIFVSSNSLGFSGNVMRVPRSSSVQAIKMDIEFLAGYTGTEERGEELIAEIDKALAYCAEKSGEIESVSKRKKVYFEHRDASGQVFACGKDTLADNLLAIIGADNAWEEYGETTPDYAKIAAANPDVVIVASDTDGYSSDDIVNEIKSRPGWENTGAARISAAFAVSGDWLRPSHRVAEYLKYIGVAVYPEIYGAYT